MTDWRSSDDPARAAESRPPFPPYGADAQGGQPQDPYGQGQQYGQQQYGQGQQYGQPAGAPYGADTYPADPNAANPYAANPYAQSPYPAPYGQPAPGYGYPAAPGYPGVDPANARPGTVIAAAVLGYVTAGLLIIAGFYCFVGASALASINDDFGSDTNGYSVQFVLAGVVNLVAAGLLIAGAVAMTTRKPIGRSMYGVGCGLVVAATVYWLAQWATKDGLGGLSVFAVLFGGLVVVGAALAFTSGNTRWFSRAR